MTRDDFFMLAANELKERLNMDAGVLVKLLLDREQESTTALSPGLAVPHIVIEGEKKFDILVARARAGVSFSPEATHVRAIFILLGTRDERNLHLRALSAIAQIATEKQFERRWLAARDTADIRNMILLSTRKRDTAQDTSSDTPWGGSNLR
jgi:mannitol/fructose-specific phosphotransferase system IIA component (Ntr-type)